MLRGELTIMRCSFIRHFAIFPLLAIFFFAGCSNDDKVANPVTRNKLSLSLSGFDSLTTGHYEVWAVRQATYTSLGQFNIRFNGSPIDLNGSPIPEFTSSQDLGTASRLAVTIEPQNDIDPNPSQIEILTGDVTGDNLNLTFKVNYSGRAGNYVIITPSDGGGFALHKVFRQQLLGRFLCLCYYHHNPK